MPDSPTSTGRVLPAYRLPGLSLRAATFVVQLAVREFPGWDRPTGRPQALSVVDAVRLTLCRLRPNATYQDLHGDFGVGTTTAWDYHQQMVAFLADVLGAADRPTCPCWSPAGSAWSMASSSRPSTGGTAPTCGPASVAATA